MIFYKHFPSKARLIAEYLRHKTVVRLEMLATATERAGLSPVESILAIFNALDVSFQKPPFRGCPLVKGLAEFAPDANSPEVQATIAAYFHSLHELVADIVAPLESTRSRSSFRLGLMTEISSWSGPTMNQGYVAGDGDRAASWTLRRSRWERFVVPKRYPARLSMLVEDIALGLNSLRRCAPCGVLRSRLYRLR